MSTSNKVETITHYIYGIDARDGNFVEVSYDNGASDHPANWGGKLTTAKRYPSYQDAWNRMQHLYKEIRSQGLHKLAGISFGIITTHNSTTFTEQTAEKRMAEFNAHYSKHEFKSND
jgi:hypothetical protein